MAGNAGLQTLNYQLNFDVMLPAWAPKWNWPAKTAANTTSLYIPEVFTEAVANNVNSCCNVISKRLQTWGDSDQTISWRHLLDTRSYNSHRQIKSQTISYSRSGRRDCAHDVPVCTYNASLCPTVVSAAVLYKCVNVSKRFLNDSYHNHHLIMTKSM